MSSTDFAQFLPLQDAALDKLIELSQSLAQQVEKLARLQFDAGMESSREAVAATQALLEVKDGEGLSKWQDVYCQPNFERVAESARQQYAVLLETRGILADAIKKSTFEATRKIQDSISRIAEGAPDGFEPLFDAIGNSLATQLAALDSMGKVADQLNEIADANLLALKDAAPPPAAVKPRTRRKAG
jgi:phasin family protein